MFGAEVRALIFQVVGSWQVWAVTIALVIYITLVRYVARLNKRSSRPASAPKAKKEKAGAKLGAAPKAAASSKTDELGLEEAGDGVAIEEQ